MLVYPQQHPSKHFELETAGGKNRFKDFFLQLRLTQLRSGEAKVMFRSFIFCFRWAIKIIVGWKILLSLKPIIYILVQDTNLMGSLWIVQASIPVTVISFSQQSTGLSTISLQHFGLHIELCLCVCVRVCVHERALSDSLAAQWQSISF